VVALILVDSNIWIFLNVETYGEQVRGYGENVRA